LTVSALDIDRGGVGGYFFRVVEQYDGSWACRRGRVDLDFHHTQEDALAHMTELAQQERPSALWVHDRDGNAQRVADFP
jgi:Uncharacterized protein conserved in bacteria (DUF2188)